MRFSDIDTPFGKTPRWPVPVTDQWRTNAARCCAIDRANGLGGHEGIAETMHRMPWCANGDLDELSFERSLS